MTVPPIPVITIDGPSGVGKGTLARWLGNELGWHTLDSGALYRLTALAAQQQNIALDDAEALAELAANLAIRFAGTAEQERIYLNEQEISQSVRTESCGNAASIVAALPAVRTALLQRQRDFRQQPGLVAEGRDMGTVVFTEAQLKIFLTASAEERAKRRYKQLKEKGINANLAPLTQEVVERDRRDSQRQIAPLKPAADAHILDTTGLDIAAVRSRTLALVERHL